MTKPRSIPTRLGRYFRRKQTSAVSLASPEDWLCRISLASSSNSTANALDILRNVELSRILKCPSGRAAGGLEAEVGPVGLQRLLRTREMGDSTGDAPAGRWLSSHFSGGFVGGRSG